MSDQLFDQDIIETRILAFLSDHFSHWFTVEDLAKEQSIASTEAEIQPRIDTALQQGLVREKMINGKRSFQPILRKKHIQ
jgi:hypothetical protein